MRIAFVSGNRELLPDAVIPLGLLYVMAATPAHHEKVLWDLCFEDDPQATLARNLAAFQPDLVALGMRNIQNNDYSDTSTNIQYYQDLVATVRAHSRAPVVLGGGGFSVMPEKLLLRLGADFGIAGEGESAFVALVEALQSGGDTNAIGNLHTRRTGGLQTTVHSNPPALGWQNLDQLAVPDRSAVDPRHYGTYHIDSVQTKRGCALHCDYCTYPLIEGRAVRQRSPEAVADEMCLSIEKRPEIKHFFIVDSVVNLPPRHAKAVCRALIDRKWQVPWTAYANPLAFDRELADLMVAAGCAGVEIGSDSGVDRVLTAMKKGFLRKDIERMHQTCAAAGLRDCHTFILGTPGETLDDVAESLDFCRDLSPFAAILMIWLDDAESLDPELAAERAVFRDQVKQRVLQKADEFPRWIIPPLGVNFDPRLFDFLRTLGMAGPLWQHLDRLDGRPRTRKRRLPLSPAA
ncbi:MAG: radical SAM protein [Deltaproteobacteria bacterium]|nr:radical SAM protein [Deltaproteobacteria bacterium]